MAAALSFGSVQAQAARENDLPLTTITQTGDVTGVIEVVSEDGERWTKVKASDLGIPVRIELENPIGFVRGYNLGMLGGPGPSSHLLTPYHPPSYTRTYAVRSRVTEYNLVHETAILALCNERLSSGDGLGETHNLIYDATLSIWGWMGTDSDPAGNSLPSQFRTITVPVPVKCTKNIVPDVIGVEMVRHGETCPRKIEVKTTLSYSQPTVAKFRFRVDGKLSKLHTVEARPVVRENPGLPQGPNSYVAEGSKTYYLDPGSHTVRVEVRGGKKSEIQTLVIGCPPFKVTEAWLNYKVQNTPVCPKNVEEVATFKANQPSPAPFVIKTQGGLVVHRGLTTFERKGMEYVATVKRNFQMSAFESLMIAEISGWTSTSGVGQAFLKVDCLELAGGDFSFIDNTGTRCPREGKALINFSMNIQENIPYEFACSHGNFSGVAQAVPGNNGGFVAPALVKFNIANTTQANCALKSVVAGQTKIHKVKGHLFKCVSRPVDTQSNDLTVETTPPAGATETNPGGIVVDPVRTVSCIGGIVRNRSCNCARTRKKVKLGPNAWRCDRQVLVDPTPPPTTPPGSGPGRTVDPVRTVSCTNGYVRNRSCFCPNTHKKVSVGRNAWRCDREVVSDPVRTDGQQGGVPGASPGTKPVSGQPTRANPTATGGQPTRANPTATGGQPTRANPNADKRRLDELKKKQAAEALAKRKAAAAAAAKQKAAAAAVAKRKAAAAAAAKKKAAAAAVAKRKAAAAVAAKKKAAAAVAAKKKAAAAKKKAAAAKAKKKAAAAKKKVAPKISCNGGKVKNGRCRCPKKKTLVNGQCIKPAG